MLQNIFEGSRVAIASAAAALALPPTSYALVPDAWTAYDYGGACVPEFELEIWGAVAVAMTNVVLYGGTLQPLVVADTLMTSASAATNKITKAAHTLKTGDGPFQFTTAAGLPGGIELATNYWLIVDTANTFSVASSFALAMAGTALDLTSNGTDLTLVDTADTKRVHWTTHDGLLGLAGDGAIAIGATTGYRKRIPHSPRVIAYALVGTLDTGAVSAAIFPIQDR